MKVVALTFLLCVSIGCSSDGSVKDAGADADAAQPVPRPPAPQVQNQGGPVLATPRVVPIFFANDAMQGQVEDFLQKLASSTYWTATTSEYGVGPLTVASSIVVSDPPPAVIDTAGIEAWLAAYLDGNPNDLFAIFYPTSTTVSDATFGTSCKDFNGFHYQGVKNTQIVYAVLPRCPSAGALTGVDALTASLSHELVEAATDPLLETAPAWSFTDVDHLIWSYLPGAEVADMCDLEPQSFQRLVGPYVVQRSWSNASARAGHDPCVPVLSEPYFNAAPVLNAKQQITFNSQVLTTNGLQLAVGESKTIAVRLFSDAPTSDWSVDAIDTSQPPSFGFSWDAQTGNDGDVLHLTITRNSSVSSEIALESHAGTTTNLWFAFVTE
jgi:hypothetical protein